MGPQAIPDFVYPTLGVPKQSKRKVTKVVCGPRRGAGVGRQAAPQHLGNGIEKRGVGCRRNSISTIQEVRSKLYNSSYAPFNDNCLLILQFDV